MFINLTSFLHMFNLVLIKKTINLSQNMDFSWDAAFEGRKAAQRDRKDAHLGARRPAPTFLGTNSEVLGVSRPL